LNKISILLVGVLLGVASTISTYLLVNRDNLKKGKTEQIDAKLLKTQNKQDKKKNQKETITDTITKVNNKLIEE
jgi:uncharacterized membrane protein (DUF106 family)